jgi:hypothetical protein
MGVKDTCRQEFSLRRKLKILLHVGKCTNLIYVHLAGQNVTARAARHEYLLACFFGALEHQHPALHMKKDLQLVLSSLNPLLTMQAHTKFFCKRGAIIYYWNDKGADLPISWRVGASSKDMHVGEQ